MQGLIEQIIKIVDQIIEEEAAFGMVFGGIAFEARYKVNNSCCYPRQQIQDLETCTKILADVGLYFERQRIYRRFCPKFTEEYMDQLIDSYYARTIDMEDDTDLDGFIFSKLPKF